jgi:hypothetical protein
MLSGMDFADQRALVDRADKLWTHTARQHHDVVVAIAEVHNRLRTLRLFVGRGDRAVEPTGSRCRHRRKEGPVEGQTDVSGGPEGDGRQQPVLIPHHLRQQGDKVQEALCVVGKLAVQPCINAVMPGSLFHIEDQLTHRRFFCDTGASYSILPHQSFAVASGPSLHGPAIRPIKCWG